MKKIPTILTLLALVALPVKAERALPITVKTVLTNLAYAAIPSVARVETIVAGSDATGGTLKMYQAGPAIVVTNALSAGYSNILCTTTGNTITNGDVILIHCASAAAVTGDVFQRAIVWSTNASGILITNDLTATVTEFALSPGDYIYKMTALPTRTVGATLTQIGSGSTIFQSSNGRPLLIELTSAGTTTNQFLLIGAKCD